MFNDPFVNENIWIEKTTDLVDYINNNKIGKLFYGTGYSTVDTHTPEIVNDILSETIVNICRIHYHPNMNLSKLWVNINPPGSYQSRHTHSEFPVAGTYYLKVPENSGNLIFYHPSPHVESLQRLKPFYPFTHIHVPCDGDLLMWPGYMSHEVSYNYSNENRITVSFCLDL
jgi:uncharacterized protein (TIGR02466 family)